MEKINDFGLEIEKIGCDGEFVFNCHTCTRFGFKYFIMASAKHFCEISKKIFRYYLPLETGETLHLNINTHHPNMLCAKLWCNWPSSSGEDFFLLSSMYFCYFVIIYLLKRAGPFILKTWFPITQERCQVWLKLVVLEKKIFKSCQFIFINSQLSPLWEGRGPSFEQTWIPFTQGYFVPSLVEIGPVVLEKKMKMWKVYRQTDGQTDRQTDRQTDGRTDGRQVIRKAHLSFQLRWAKKGVEQSVTKIFTIWRYTELKKSFLLAKKGVIHGI